ncbi:MarR family winged helix-turn-helix transcriptional regulator [Demequina gelatinilytica]|uniref:MarR family winged helix-turn-helix transcriptional regulator n=1 Tax=Demequina gelatinilytica TaxID=1638980 RepID=UPI000784E7A1|nr:MarR family transcriptional regulator [Demequina gelatinilytica]
MGRDDAIAEILELQHRLVRRSMRDHSRTLVAEALTPIQFHLLVFLHGAPGVPTAEAAEVLGVRPNIATGVVQRLVDRGWIERTASPDDARVRLLSLTAAGVALVDEATREAERGFVAHLAALSDAQIGQLREILATIVADGGALADRGDA